MFHDPAGFGFAAPLRAAWREIRDEYRAIRTAAEAWPERELYGEGWDVLGLYDFPHGRPLALNILLCPTTARLVGELLPGHGAAGFSILKPGTRIRPHVGYQGDFLRCHLGLEVPEGDCALEVAGERRSWAEGELLVFDDRVEHAAWNLTDRERVVLLADFVPEVFSRI